MIRRLAAVGAIAWIVVGLGAQAASAHALVRQSTPANGAVIQTAPRQVTMTFTEPPELGLTVIHLLDSTGRDVEIGPPQLAAGSKVEIVIPVRAEIPDGVYTVTWRIVSRADGHVTAGSFSFGVGVSPGQITPPAGVTVGSSSPSPSAVDAIGRWAFYWGLALLIAAGVVGLLAFGNRVPGSRWVLVGAWAAAAVGLVIMTASERSTVGVSLSQLFQSTPGKDLLKQGIGIAITASAVTVAILMPGRVALWLVAVGAAATMFLHAQAGHANASAHYAWFDVPVQWLHMVSVGVWVGGLAWLLIGTRAREGAERTAPVQRFSWLAGIALAVVAVTGLLRMISEVGGPASWSRLVTTAFGVTVLIKIGLFAGLVALGARNRYVNVPGVVSGAKRIGSLRRTVVAELLIAAGVLGATGVLTQLPPASSLAASRSKPAAAQSVVVTGHDFATSVRARLEVTPGTVGPNAFRLSIVDFDTGATVPVRAVNLTFSLPGHPELGTPTVELKGNGDAWTGSSTVLSLFGTWQVTAVVQESSTSVSVPLSLTTRLPPERITISPGRGDQPTVYTVRLSGGNTVQGYVDPATTGPNQAHFTFFRSSGKELAIASATASEILPSGEVRSLKLIRFDQGHFVANVDLEAGRWTFLIDATPRGGGETISAHYSQSIGG